MTELNQLQWVIVPNKKA